MERKKNVIFTTFYKKDIANSLTISAALRNIVKIAFISSSIIKECSYKLKKCKLHYKNEMKKKKKKINKNNLRYYTSDFIK